MRRDSYAFITGASMGLGKAFAENAAAIGWNVILAALPGTGLSTVADEIEQRYRVEAVIFECDLTDRNARNTILRWIEWNNVQIDLCINNAGVGCPGLFTEAAQSKLAEVVALNAQALTQLTYGMIPALKGPGPSTVINVASLAGFYPMPAMAVYAATKSYVLNFTLALREEVRDLGISVSALCPGGISTNPEVTARINAQGIIGRLSGKTPEEVAEYALKRALRGKALIIPGILNRLLRLFGTAVPKQLAAKIIGVRFHKAEQQARINEKLSSGEGDLLQSTG